MTDVALVTFAEFPDGYEDDHVLVAALERRGITSEWTCWDDPDARWSAAGMALLRSPWDYHERIEGFLGWVDYVATVTRLQNDATTVRWNCHKGYLLELESRGVPIVPTTLVRRGARFDLGDEPYVVKPAVSAGARSTTRHATQADLDALTAVEDALVQPYIADIEERGELSIVCVNGEVTHVVRKVPAAGDFRSQEHHGASIESIAVTEAHRTIAAAALAVAPSLPLYARVDVADTPRGLLLMELELIEPTLWLQWHPPAADALVDAIEALLIRSR